VSELHENMLVSMMCLTFVEKLTRQNRIVSQLGFETG
jgi:hypothetical protein